MSVFRLDRVFFTEVVTLTTGAVTSFSGMWFLAAFWSRGIDLAFLPGRVVAADSTGCAEASGAVACCPDSTVFFFGVFGSDFSAKTAFSFLAGARLVGPLGSNGVATDSTGCAEVLCAVVFSFLAGARLVGPLGSSEFPIGALAFCPLSLRMDHRNWSFFGLQRGGFLFGLSFGLSHRG